MPHEDQGEPWADVEFLDPDDPGADDVLWLDEEGVDSGAGPTGLPSRATPHRILASLLALGLFLAGTGSAAAAAYHRHLTDRQMADELVLVPSPTSPAVPDLASLGFATVWHARVTERVLVPVVNGGPRPVDLLGAVLTELGLVSSVQLEPVTGRVLKPGDTAEFAGTVTADCTLVPAGVVVGGPYTGNASADAVGTAQLLVRARTSGGETAAASVDPESASPSLQERICGQEGDDLTGPVTVATAADPKAHTVTIRLATASNADTRVSYAATAQFSIDPGFDEPGVHISEPAARDPSAGDLNPGAALTQTFVIDVGSCETRRLPSPDNLNLQLQVLYSVRGVTLAATDRSVPLDSLVLAACGSLQ